MSCGTTKVTFRDYLRRRVLNGIMLLDLNVPGWDSKINLNNLYLHDPHSCILCHIFGKSFLDGQRKCNLDNSTDFIFGFNISIIKVGSLYKRWNKNCINDRYWDTLESIWKEEILLRRQNNTISVQPIKKSKHEVFRLKQSLGAI